VRAGNFFFRAKKDPDFFFSQREKPDRNRKKNSWMKLQYCIAPALGAFSFPGEYAKRRRFKKKGFWQAGPSLS
jgi:hypothetical protein